MSAPAPRANAAATLAAGLTLATVSMLLTHPLAVLAALLLALLFARRSGALSANPLLLRLAVGLAVAVAGFNALFSWNGATVLWQAPFRIDLLGRPQLTLEAMAWGAVAGAQLAATALALGAATLTTPPETLHRALTRLGLPRTAATAASLSLRLVPETSRDAHAMGKALRTRGVETGGLRGTSHVLVPLTARTLDRAQLAEQALTIRGYGPGRPAERCPLPREAWLAAAGCLGALALAIWGPGRPGYYPELAAELALPALALVLLGLVIPAALVLGVDPSSR